MNKTISGGLSVIGFLIILFGPAFLAETFAADLLISGKHPVELSRKPACTECHTAGTEVAQKPIEVFNHDANWIRLHRFHASKALQLCNSCHKVSFCNECHAYKEELKPSDKDSDEPERWLPHRGDYIFQHRIDARIDPSACFRCHGRQNNHICRRCHK